MVTPLELSANIMTAVCIFLAGRNNIHTWWTGIVACILFAFLFFDVKLYADVTLQIFFIATGIIGWMNWKMRDREITSIKSTNLILNLVLANVVALMYGSILYTFTDAYAPFVDSLVLTFSVLGQFLLMKRYVQAWPVWVVVNILSVPLYFSRELYLTAGMYSLFLLNAIYSWYSWNKQLVR
jgi:nicotinamide mononucleotide transporter